MTKLFLAIVVAIGLAGCQKAEQKPVVANIAVETIKCEMCVKNVETAVQKVDGVKKVSVDLKAKVATIEFIAGQTRVALLETAITKAGYDANQTKRDEAAYQALPTCCQ